MNQLPHPPHRSHAPQGSLPPHGSRPPYDQRASTIAMPRDPYRTRKLVGAALWLLGMLGGGGLLLFFFVLLPMLEANATNTFFGFAVGATLAFPAMCVYLTFPRLLDRYDPEPLYALLLCLLWGAVAACGFSAAINTLVGSTATSYGAAIAASLGLAVPPDAVGEFVGAVISAPLVEEAWKGLAVFGVFYFLRNEFDGVVDGIIYATFVAIGFAATENVIYYGRALGENPGALVVTFVLRGLIAPWGHPLYTSMTGIGFGLARESHRRWVKLLAPLCGYAGAVFLHAVWNGSASLSTALGADYVFILLLPLWLFFVLAFVILVMVLVARRGRIIRENLIDEVALGYLTQRELDLTCSAFGGLVAWFRKGSAGAEFVRSVSRLGLSKWHVARAARGRNSTYSLDFVLPLRSRIQDLRARGASPA